MRDVPWESIFKLGTFATASEFCELVQVRIDVYIPHGKYQIKPVSSPWFSAACAADIFQRNYFFPLYQQNKSSKFGQVSICCKMVLEAAKLAYENLKTFLRVLILMTQVYLPVFPSRTNLKFHNFSVTPKIAKKIITNFDSSKACGPDRIAVY